MLETTTPALSERDAYLRRTTLAIAQRLVGQMLAELAEPSTDSASLQDRMMLRVLTPWMPRLQAALLSKLSEVDPVALERTAGALALAIESVLAQAPGDPRPRFRVDWDAAGHLVLLPLELV